MLKYLFLLLTMACGTQTHQDSKVIYVAPHLADCTGVGPQKCMLIKEEADADWTYFYDQIEGFNYEEGYLYSLLVDIKKVNDPPADASGLQYILKEVLSKELSAQDLSLYQNWKITALKGLDNIDESPTLEFHEDSKQVNGFAGCNNFFGSFSTSAHDLSFGPLGMTRKMCESMVTEDLMARYLDQIKSYEIADGVLILKNEDNEGLIFCIPLDTTKP